MPIPSYISTAYVLNRQEYISQLGRSAAKLNVEIQTNDKIRSINDLDGDYIVDASGCPSTIKKEPGFNRGLRGIGYQETLEDSNYFTSDTLSYIYLGTIGYYWIFPRRPEKKEINVGMGVIGNSKYNLKKLLEKFKNKWKIEGNINYSTGGLIPAGLQRPLMYNNILFVGDAGVGTFPFTGEGIHRALLSGEIAGKCIALEKPEQYPSIIVKAKIMKYDIIGATLIKTGGIIQNISPKAFLKSLKYFFELFYFPIFENV